MKIEIWSDYACPYCYVGKRHLEQALKQFPHAKTVEIVHRAFELDPTVSAEVNTTTQQRIERKYGRSPAAAMDFIRSVEHAGKRVGLEMNYETVQYSNTFDSHRLTKLAATLGKEVALNERLFRAYFTENAVLSNRETLLKCAEDVGISRDLAAKMLDSEQFADDVRLDEQQAARLGIHGVPFFVIDGKLGMSGAQPVEMMLQAMDQAWSEQTKTAIAEGMACGVDGCH
ncbi:disulfide bond formation protein DsbA [Neisseria chenwenguii]|uniref:Disulfide bond formation protein DsbA n=1 Tax=Neisseria chenwenguii TaxID=1853278 RepID=A0A220RZC5_9NEIS|nr:disulfide bond formation protein DsbA [Neisseria chenwenguii]